MPATYTASLRLTKPAVGDTNWGTTVNSGFTDLTDSAIAGYTTVSMPSNADYTLTSNNGAADESRSMMLNITSAVSLTVTRNIICPTVSKLYSIKNATTGGQSIVLKTSGGTGVTIPNGATMLLACNGTNVVAAIDYISFSNLAYTGTLTGGTGVVNIGSGQVYKDASGNVGIGTSSPVTALNFQAGATISWGTSLLSIDYVQAGAGSVAIGTNGSQKLVVNSSGNLGLGVTPTYKFDVSSGASASAARFASTGSSVILRFADGTAETGYIGSGTGLLSGLARTDYGITANASGALVLGSNNTERARIDSSGNVGIGTASPAAKLDVNGLIRGTVGSSTFEAIGAGDLTINASNAAGQIAFRTAGAERARIDSSGNFIITGAGGLGYGTGSGGAVTQATSRTTSVTLNKTNGSITLVSAAGTTSWQSFVVNNSTVAATDTVIVNQKSGADKYLISVTGVNAGSFTITFATTGATTTEQPVFNFAVIKAVTA